MTYSDFLYHLYQAYEQFNLTKEAKRDAYMCLVLDGVQSSEEGDVNRFFFNATGVEMADMWGWPEKLKGEILSMQDTYCTEWVSAIREELFGTDKDIEGDKGQIFFGDLSQRYSNQLRQQWILSQYEKAMERGE